MTGEWIRFAAASGLLILGVGFMVAAVFGVNRFHHALNRMHAAALGDTLGLLFVILGTITMRGFSMDSLKLAMVIVFFWIASPVCSHMISRLEAMTDESLGEIMVLEKNNGVRVEQTENIKAGEKAVSKKKKQKKGGRER
ncbi:MAG: monovalent cation/H(+) antiporter subunit G [Hungatella sp.]|jgi:multicomponent Na+:H+ antiporter subunit G|nr:monovalent cation/H(+) antiporter subunit G [Hungatella sp.]